LLGTHSVNVNGVNHLSTSAESSEIGSLSIKQNSLTEKKFNQKLTGGIMKSIAERAVRTELQFRNALIRAHDSFFAKLKDDRGDVPGWVLVVLMTTGLVTAIWTIAAPRLTAILKDSLDSMNGIR
jgi:hypothetical protein